MDQIATALLLSESDSRQLSFPMPHQEDSRAHPKRIDAGFSPLGRPTHGDSRGAKEYEAYHWASADLVQKSPARKVLVARSLPRSTGAGEKEEEEEGEGGGKEKYQSELI
jgi:hypothetical protein